MIGINLNIKILSLKENIKYLRLINSKLRNKNYLLDKKIKKLKQELEAEKEVDVL
jgi:hypothetical protein|tara:strand:+ start:1805 stop:1969 length:165 start_codon:yes stop_codon:yes gene_type:complete